MKMYLSRNKNGELTLHEDYPNYIEGEDIWRSPIGVPTHFMDRRASPEVTFENSPMEVELVIKK